MSIQALSTQVDKLKREVELLRAIQVTVGGTPRNLGGFVDEVRAQTAKECCEAICPWCGDGRELRVSSIGWRYHVRSDGVHVSCHASMIHTMMEKKFS